MIERLYKLVERVLFFGGILLTIFIVGELMRVVILVYRFSHVAGYIALAALLAGGLYALHRTFQFARAYPRILHPPFVPEDLREASHQELKRYAGYLLKTCKRLSTNGHLAEEQGQLAWQHAEELDQFLSEKPSADSLVVRIEELEEGVIFPLFDILSAQAEAEILACERELMDGAGLIPFPFLDVFAMGTRIASMVLRVVDRFHDRPGIHEQIFILRDVLRVVLQTPAARLSRSLQSHLIKHLALEPGAAETVGRSLNAGLMVRLAGQAAVERCAAFQGWEMDEAIASLFHQLPEHVNQTREVLNRDVLHNLMRRLPTPTSAEGTESLRQREELMRTWIGKAIDQTRAGVPELLPPPVPLSSPPPSRRTDSRSRPPSRSPSRSPGRSRSRQPRRRGIARIVHLVSQKWRYGSRPGF